MLELTRKQVNEQTYAIQNKGDAGKTVIVEHPRQADWKLVEPASAEETTDALYRFKTRVEGHKTAKFAVKTENVMSQEVQILSTDVDAAGGVHQDRRDPRRRCARRWRRS